VRIPWPALLVPSILGFQSLPAPYQCDGGDACRQAGSVDYRLRVDAADLSGVTLEMRVHGAPGTFRVAMVAHTEYDDQYWRYLTQLRGESSRGPVQVTREDSSLWRVDGPAGDVTLRYSVRFPESPPLQQASWKAHLTPTGGLVGGPHSFLYVVGGERWPVTVTALVPVGWTVVTGLDSVAGQHTYVASGAEALVDAPMLVGLIRSWRFDLDRVPHQIAYLGRPTGVPFDTAVFVANVERIARESARLFGTMPYRKFQFLVEDGTYGGLEHVNSVSIGTQSSDLARDPTTPLGLIAHEFFHIWNEVQVRPRTWIGVRYVAPAPTGELWWSEGVTIFFADLVLRRAGLPTIDSTRVHRLERLIANYLANPSHAMVSPEETSRAFNRPPAVTGDYTPNMFLQGELLGVVLDLMIRDASGGRRSLDDAMRSLSQRFTIERGITGQDVENAVAEACGCDVASFFASYVRTPSRLDFDRWLGLIGLRSSVTWAAALAPDSTPAPDLRLSANSIPGDSAVQLKMWFPGTLWARAGLHTGDRLESLNGVAIRDVAQFRQVIGRLHVGDTVHVAAWRDSARIETTFTVTGYERPRVQVTLRPDATTAQRALLTQWAAGR
jgi:predicted metalloprotease with PDZ domain